MSPRAVRLVAREQVDEAAQVPNSERVYRALRDQILTGALAPLTRLVELQVAQLFAVSRTPVREALKRLIAEGLVVGDPLRGMVVRDVDPAEVEDIYIIREVLDGLAARLAAARATPDDLTRLHLLMELMAESAAAQRWEAVVQINIKFHEVLYAAAGNERLALIGRSLQDAVRRYSPRALSDPDRVAAVLKEHAEIVRAVEAHDLPAAEQVRAATWPRPARTSPPCSSPTTPERGCIQSLQIDAHRLSPHAVLEPDRQIAQPDPRRSDRSHRRRVEHGFRLGLDRPALDLPPDYLAAAIPLPRPHRARDGLDATQDLGAAGAAAQPGRAGRKHRDARPPVSRPTDRGRGGWLSRSRTESRRADPSRPRAEARGIAQGR